MRKTAGLSMVLIVLAATAALWAQGKATPAKGEEKARAELSIRVVGLQVSAPTYRDDYAMQPFDDESGICMALLIESRTKNILEFCEDKGKFLALKDNKGTNLQGGQDWRDEIGEPEFGYPQVSEDGKAVLFQLRGEKTPAPGSTRVKAQGIVRLILATKLEKARQKNVLLQLDAEITAGPVPMRIMALEAPISDRFPMRITLSAEKRLTAIKAIRFYDEEGRAVKSEMRGRGGSTRFGKRTYRVSVGIAKKLKKADIEIEYWKDAQEQPVPFSLEVGLSLQ